MRILVKRRGALGDVLNITPVIRRLRTENPDADIRVETLHPEALFNNPNKIALGGSTSALGYDKVFDLNGVYERDRKIHQVDAHMKAVFGDTGGPKEIQLTFPADMKVSTENYVVIHPNISWPSRTFPLLWWNEVALLLSDRYTVIVTGTLNDHKLSGDKIFDLRSRLDLSAQAALINGAKAFVCGDSGMATLAGATETPIVVMCTITRAEYFMPYRHGLLGWNCVPLRTSMSCYGCSELEPPSEYYSCRRGDNACVTSDALSPDVVYYATLGIIDECHNHG